jgi:hypothetical protein
MVFKSSFKLIGTSLDIGDIFILAIICFQFIFFGSEACLFISLFALVIISNPLRPIVYVIDDNKSLFLFWYKFVKVYHNNENEKFILEKKFPMIRPKYGQKTLALFISLSNKKSVLYICKGGDAEILLDFLQSHKLKTSWDPRIEP